jgi:hypothetical protein
MWIYVSISDPSDSNRLNNQYLQFRFLFALLMNKNVYIIGMPIKKWLTRNK